MKQFTLSYFKRLVLMLLAVIGFTTTSYAQDWNEIYNNPLGQSNKGEFVSGDNDIYFDGGTLSTLNSTNRCANFQAKPAGTDKYIAVKYNIEQAGTYKFSYRINGNFSVALFYSNENGDLPSTSNSDIINVVGNAVCSSITTTDYESSEFEIKTPGEYFFGFYVTEATEYWLYFCDFRLFKDESAPAVTTYNVTLASVSNGTVKVYENGAELTLPATVEENTELTVEATADQGYELTALTANGSDIMASKSFTVTADTEIAATFTEAVAPVEKYAQNYGTGNGDGRSWTTAVFNTTTDGSKTINVNFDTNKSSYEIFSDALVSEDNKISVYPGETFTLTVNGNLNWLYTIAYVDWNGDGVFDEETENLGYNPVEERNFGGNSASTRTYSIEVPENAVVGSTRIRVVLGWKQTIMDIVPDNEEKIVKTITSTEITDKKNAMARDFYLNIMTNDISERTVTVNVNDDSMGSAVITGTTDTSVTTSDLNVSVTATPNEGYMFVNWTNAEGLVVSTDNPYVYNGVDGITLTANFTEKTYPVMSRKFTTINQQNRYLKEVVATVGGEAQTLFTATTQEELPVTEYLTEATWTEDGALIDKTATPVVLSEGTTSFDMTFKAWTDNITVNGQSYATQIVWTSQAIYVDWNNDKDFDDANECLGAVGTPANGNNFGDENGSLANGWSRTLNVPEGTPAGSYKMRVVYSENSEEGWDKTFFVAGKGELNAGISYDFTLTVVAAPVKFAVTLNKPVNGDITVTYADQTVNTADFATDETSRVFEVEENTELTVTTTPATGYKQATLTYTVADVSTDITEGKVIVTSDMTIEATFVEDGPVLSAIRIPASENNQHYQFRFDDIELGSHNHGNYTDDTRSRNITMSAWIKLNSTADGQVMGYGQKQFWDCEGTFSLRLKDGAYVLKNRSRTGEDGTVGTDNDVVTTQQGETDKWAFVTVVYDDTNKKRYFYYNGNCLVDEAIANLGLGILNDESVFYVSNNDLSLDLDEVQVWNKALTKDEVVSSMTSVNGDEEGLIYLYRFTEKNEDYTYNNMIGESTTTASLVKGTYAYDSSVWANVYTASTVEAEQVEGHPEVVPPTMYKVYWEGDPSVMVGGSLKVVYASDETQVVENGVTEVPAGTELKVIATPESGYVLKSLSYALGDGEFVTLSEPYTFTLTDNAELSAEFEQEGPKAYDLTWRMSGKMVSWADYMAISVDGEEVAKSDFYTTNGVVEDIAENSTVKIQIVGNTAKYSLTLTVGGEVVELDADGCYEFTMTEDTSVEAVFNEPAAKYNYTVNKTGEGNVVIKSGNAEYSAESGQLDKDSEFEVVATPESGYTVASLEVTVGGVAAEPVDGKYTATGDVVVTVVFEEELVTYTVTWTTPDAAEGTLVVKSGDTELTSPATVEEGTTLTVEATAAAGYKLTALTYAVDGGEALDIMESKSFEVTGNIVLTAVFEQDGSSINSLSADGIYYDAAEEVLYTASAAMVKVYDLSGRLVLNAENQETVSVAELADGIYTAVVDGKVLKFKK